MKATAKFWTGCLAMASAFWASGADAAPHPLAFQLDVGRAVLGQTADGNADRRREADDLLRRARQAMKDGQLDQADDMVRKAEKLGVVYDTVFARFVDTPEKARKDLEALRARQSKNAKPSDRFKPTPVAGTETPKVVEPAAAAPRDPNFDPAEKLATDAASAADAAMLRGARSGFLANPGQAGPDLLDKVPQLGGSDKPLRPGAFVPPDASAKIEAAGRAAENLGRNAGNAVENAGRAMSRLPESAEEGLRAAGGDAKRDCIRLLAQAQAALYRGDANVAQQLLAQAKALQVPDDQFLPGEPHPSLVGLEVERALSRRSNANPGNANAGGVMQAGAVAPAGGGNEAGGRYPVAQGLYDPTRDRTRTVRVQNEEPTPAVRGESPTVVAGRGQELFEQGLRALEQQDREGAVRAFREAWGFADQLDPATRAALKDKLSLLQDVAAPQTPGREPSALEAVDAKQQLLRQQLYREITNEQDAAKRLITTDPKGSLTRLQRLRDRVAESDLDPPSRKQLLAVVDRNLGDLEKFIEANRSDIENNERNRQVLESVDRDRNMKSETQNKIAELVEQFNQLMDERRYQEAEVKARQARALDPDNPVVQTLMWKSKFAIRMAEQNAIKDRKEQGVYAALTRVDEASEPFDDSNPLQFPVKGWDDLKNSRKKLLERQKRRLTPAEQEIQRSLSKPVEVRFNNRPLKEVMETLAVASGISIHLDNAGLGAEGVTSDTPVTINLLQQISLKSALNLILEELHLSYVIQNEVLKITSEQTRHADVYPQVYDVADLVIPIPNFTPGYNIGLPHAIAEAHRSIGRGGFGAPAGMAPMTLASSGTGEAGGGSVLAQMGQAGLIGQGRGNPQQLGSGPGGLGGGAQPDFDSLIELITATIAPTSWSEVGGAGTIEPFPTNLSIVVSTTQEVHDQIADLLEQLRRLQDLQVTIEVRFITLRDNFFERLGVGFDFRIEDNSGLNGNQGQFPDQINGSYIVGLNNLNGQSSPTATLDIPFTQGSFASTVPQFGGFDANTAANFGFAILSDIEVYLLLQAAQGDQRSNVLQAPKVTLFNGQQASVSDSSQRPFVTSIIPVVGDFAAAHQPVIVVLNEGTSLSVQAVVSANRRFVRLTLVPFFSKIGDVQEFTFSGKTTTKSGTNVKDPSSNTGTVQDNVEVTKEGTTVQLPTFAFTTVSTTVSVPDGGTVLLGGIKRLFEARSERGVPMLNKIPYVNRLFKNVGIGRETSSLMLMVTPRIIIQEEEEAKLGIDLTP